MSAKVSSGVGASLGDGPARQVEYICECTICCETTTRSSPCRVINDSQICDDCVIGGIVPLFHAALVNEVEYPVRWGSVTLEAVHFEAELGKEFAKRYAHREKQYLIPAKYRVVCQHNILTDPELIANMDRQDKLLVAFPARVLPSYTESKMATCNAILNRITTVPGANHFCSCCLGFTCPTCRQPTTASSYGLHRCIREQIVRDGPNEAGMVRGRDYQLCPNTRCGQAASLGDGCNHLICPAAGCRTEFCYICGELGVHDSDHWTKKCPRWNQPDAANAIFDQPVPNNDDNDDIDDEDFRYYLPDRPRTEAELEEDRLLGAAMQEEVLGVAWLFPTGTRLMADLNKLINKIYETHEFIAAQQYWPDQPANKWLKDVNKILYDWDVCVRLRKKIPNSVYWPHLVTTNATLQFLNELVDGHVSAVEDELLTEDRIGLAQMEDTDMWLAEGPAGLALMEEWS